MTSKHQIIEQVCRAVSDGALALAKQIVAEKYPFESLINVGRRYTKHRKTVIFFRDGFVDRYSGDKLVFAPVLRLLSMMMPDEFPFHKNWKMCESHLAYWHLLPAVDHIVPVCRGGADEASNWVCTSQRRNNAKGVWLLEELGWHLHEPGGANDWDGLVGWFMDYAATNPNILADRYLRSWHSSAARTIG